MRENAMVDPHGGTVWFAIRIERDESQVRIHGIGAKREPLIEHLLADLRFDVGVCIMEWHD
jgi:hypothetical protein